MPRTRALSSPMKSIGIILISISTLNLTTGRKGKTSTWSELIVSESGPKCRYLSSEVGQSEYLVLVGRRTGHSAEGRINFYFIADPVAFDRTKTPDKFD